jgi:hypothetical protein
MHPGKRGIARIQWSTMIKRLDLPSGLAGG